MKNLNFIIKIEKTDYNNLSFAKIINSKEISIPESILWEDIKLASKPAQLQISDKVDNLSNVVTSMRGVNMNATDGVIYGMKTIQ